MSAPWSAVRPLLRAALPLAASAGLFARPLSSDAKAKCTRWVVREASGFAPRESPTPLVLLRSPGITWPGVDKATEAEWAPWADMLSQRGYTTVEVDVSAAADEASPSPVIAASKALNSQLRMLGIPFAPIVIASGPASLVAQAYVSDFPASGLVLVSPPPDADPRAEGDAAWPWPEFSYEPHFPILLVGDEAALEHTRVGRAAADGVGRGGKGVSLAPEIDGPRGDKTRYVSGGGGGADGQEVERWMDRAGY
ncbi:hypothetical protein Q8F55_006902 [Vanrija albida]|uniref:AB hydrolase-1 domain-containing protein n=1 Tax=Vanrija albida TaxID=181172 RepID=A0ABR3PYD0_9TREE